MRDFTEQHVSTQDYKLIFRLLKYLKPYTGRFIVALLLMIVTTFTNMILPLASGFGIDLMTDELFPGRFNLEQKVTIVLVAAAILVLITAISIFLEYILSKSLQEIGQKITHDIRVEVFDHIEALSIGQINHLPVGKLVTRATNDPNNISQMFTETIVNLIRNILMMVIVMTILFVINPLMALITIATLPFIVFASYLFRLYSRNAYRTVRNNVSEINAFLSENLSGMRITQVFNQQSKKIDEFGRINKNLRKSSIREINIFGIYRPVIFLFAMIATLLSVYFGVKSVFTGAITIGLFVSFYVYVGQFFEPIQQIAEQFNALQNGFASAEKIFDVLDTKPTVEDMPDALDLPQFSGSIEFKNVWFQYISDEWVLKDVSFKVEPNETVAFVGATGSGKTTILQLIVRNYDIQKGQILIDGVDIKTLKRSSLRRHIGQMLQDVFLFSGSIRDNITLRDETISDEDIMKASDYVGLTHVLDKLDEGLDHIVRERGNNFSSGERQLISFARAVVYQPSLMILDEATANIDSETEEIIQGSLEKMMNISTMLIVAHRLSTIQHSDKIIVMQKGQIKEIGSHQVLLREKGLYYNLYQLQYDPNLKI